MQKIGQDQARWVPPALKWTTQKAAQPPISPLAPRVRKGIASAAIAPATTAFTSGMSGQHGQGVLDHALERLHQPRAVGAVYGPVIEAAGGAHDRRDLQGIGD